MHNTEGVNQIIYSQQNEYDYPFWNIVKQINNFGSQDSQNYALYILLFSEFD